MAKPTTITTWATDANATSDPGPTRRASGFVAGKKVPAKWLNWLFAQNAGWLTYLRDLHTEPEFLNKDYKWTQKHSFYSVAAALFSYSSPQTQNYSVKLSDMQMSTISDLYTFVRTPSQISFRGTGSASAHLYGALKAPPGATLNWVRVSCQASSETALTARVAQLTHAPSDTVNPGEIVVSTVATRAAGTSGIIYPTITPGTIMDADSETYVQITSGTQDGVAAAALYWVDYQIRWTSMFPAG